MADASVAHWSPNSEGFDYVSNQNGGFYLWRLPLGGAQPIALAHFDSGQTWNFAWSPDGRKLALSMGAVSSDVVLIRRVNAK